MPKHRSHSVEFKRQVVAEYHAGESFHALARRHDLSRNLIRIWVEKAEAGALDQDVASAELLTAYEARIAALERLVGRQGAKPCLTARAHHATLADFYTLDSVGFEVLKHEPSTDGSFGMLLAKQAST